MNLDITALYTALAESGLSTKDMLKRACITARTWAKARTGQPIRAQTAGKIAKALNVPVLSLLPKK